MNTKMCIKHGFVLKLSKTAKRQQKNIYQRKKIHYVTKFTILKEQMIQDDWEHFFGGNGQPDWGTFLKLQIVSLFFLIFTFLS